MTAHERGTSAAAEGEDRVGPLGAERHEPVIHLLGGRQRLAALR
jgi:hypothetical protein